MQIIKLNATESTNTYLKNLMYSGALPDFTAVIAERQLKGRGQMGTVWKSEAGKNLTFSVLKHVNGLTVGDQFRITVCTSLAVVAALKKINVPDLTVKWPNDILSGTSKICGILIENILQGNRLQSSIIGIGLNVNQLAFPDLENVSSLKLLLGRHFDLDELFHGVLLQLKDKLAHLEDDFMPDMEKEYERSLFRKDKPSTFEDNNGVRIMGFIKGVSSNGKLKILREDNVMEEYGLKEIRLMY